MTQSVMMVSISDSGAALCRILTLQYGINCAYLSRCGRRVLFGDDPSDDSKNDPSNLCESQTHTQAKLYLLMRLSNTPPLDSDPPPSVMISRSVGTEEAQEPLDKVVDGCLYLLLFHL